MKSKKKSVKKKALKKALKKAPAKKKKATKKKSAKQAVKRPRTGKKISPKKKALRKIAKKAPAKKKKPTIKKAEPPVVRATPRAGVLGFEGTAINIDITFRLGGGRITITQFRNQAQVDEQEVNSTGSITFSDARTGDELSINGACAGNATLVTDRPTTPNSDVNSPRKYKAEDGGIFDSLGIN